MCVRSPVCCTDGIACISIHLCVLKATMVHLTSIKTQIKPRIAISENVCTGNVNKRVVEQLAECMDSRESCHYVYKFVYIYIYIYCIC